MKYSLRIQLTLSCALAIAILLAILGITLYVGLYQAFASRFDLSLRTRTALLISALDWDSRGNVHVGSDSAAQDRQSALTLPRFYEIWTPHGRPLLLAPELNHRSLQFLQPHSFTGQFVKIHLADGHAAREFVIRSSRGDREDIEHDGHQQGHQDPRGNTRQSQAAERRPSDAAKNGINRSSNHRQFMIAVARPTGELDASLDSLQWSLIIACSAATLLSAWIIWWLLGRGLRPVGIIAEEITRVGVNDLSDRISVGGVPVELIPIVDRLNQLLQRIEDAMRREKAMTADIAHELRTPLASMRASAELALSRPRDPTEYQRMIGEFLAVELHMQHLVENFLTLARLEAKPKLAQREYRSQPAEMIRRYADEWQGLLQSRQIRLELQLIDSLGVNAPEELLRIAIRNVFENAVSYVDDGGTIRINMRRESAHVILEFGNTGSRVPHDQTSMVFERFWRGDTARSDLTRHSGLGLAIVRQAVDNCGGMVDVETQVGGWFTIRLSLPPV